LDLTSKVQKTNKLISEDKMDPIDAAAFARKLREESYYRFMRTKKRRR